LTHLAELSVGVGTANTALFGEVGSLKRLEYLLKSLQDIF